MQSLALPLYRLHACVWVSICAYYVRVSIYMQYVVLYAVVSVLIIFFVFFILRASGFGMLLGLGPGSKNLWRPMVPSCLKLFLNFSWRYEFKNVRINSNECFLQKLWAFINFWTQVLIRTIPWLCYRFFYFFILSRAMNTTICWVVYKIH